jgi:hypothetical protein
MANTPEPPRSRARSRAATRSTGSRAAGGGTRSAGPPRAAGPREPVITSRKQNPLVSIAQVLLGVTLSCSIAALCFVVLAGIVFVVYDYILK